MIPFTARLNLRADGNDLLIELPSLTAPFRVSGYFLRQGSHDMSGRFVVVTVDLQGRALRGDGHDASW